MSVFYFDGSLNILIFFSWVARAVLDDSRNTPLFFPSSDTESDMLEVEVNNNNSSSTPPGVDDDRSHLDNDYDGDEAFAAIPDERSAAGQYNGHLLRAPDRLYKDGSGGAKFSNYSPDVRAIGKLAITLIRGRFSNENPFPDSILLLWWGKAAWWEACGILDIWIASNNELIKLVRNCTTLYSPRLIPSDDR